jgi:hypothetical protein
MKIRCVSAKVALGMLAFHCQVSGWYTVDDHGSFITLKMVYGSAHITEPVICETMRHSAIERLKEVRQYGVMHYVRSIPPFSFSRYEHSLGVFLILRTYGCSIEEQLAGFLHDVSHTAFSHVGDLVFNNSLVTKCHQDSIYTWYLEEVGLADVLREHGYEIVVNQPKECWPALNQSYPNLCADRIEYNLKGGLLEDLLTEDEAHAILDALRYEHKQWHFVDTKAALSFAKVSIELSERFWCSDWNLYIYHQASNVLKRAMKLGIIDADDLHFSTDEIIWEKLCASNDAITHNYLATIQDHANYFRSGDSNNYDLHLCGRFRGLDPYVKIHGSLQRLSTLDEDFKEDLQEGQWKAECGSYIKYISSQSGE